MQGFKDWIIENSYFEGKEIDNFKFKNNYDLAEQYAEKQLALYIVSNQRELFVKFLISVTCADGIPSEIKKCENDVDKYLKFNQ